MVTDRKAKLGVLDLTDGPGPQSFSGGRAAFFFFSFHFHTLTGSCFLFPEDLKITEGRRSENSMAVVESYYGSGTRSQCGNSRAEPGEDMPQKTSEGGDSNQLGGPSRDW